MLVPIAITVLAGVAAAVKHKRDKGKDPNPEIQAQRQFVYEQALNTVKDPDALRKMAKAYADAGLIAEANMLEKRAALQELPPAVKEARREAFRKGMECKDAAKVYALADAYESQGCTGAAEHLRNHAASLPVVTIAPEPQPEQPELQPEKETPHESQESQPS